MKLVRFLMRLRYEKVIIVMKNGTRVRFFIILLKYQLIFMLSNSTCTSVALKLFCSFAL